MKFYFKKICNAVFFILVALFILTACNLKNGADTPGAENNSEESQYINNEDIMDFYLAAGRYQTGVEIEAGEYILIQSGTKKGYYELTYNTDDYVYSGNFYRKYVILNDGDKIYFKDSLLFKTEKAPENMDTDNGYLSGQYKAGFDLPAGEYVIVDNTFDFNYLEITSLPIVSPHQAEFVGNTIFEYRQYIKLENGQYIDFKKGKLYSLENAPPIITNPDLSLRPGQYLIGTHIPEGNYTFIPDKDNTSVYFITDFQLPDYINYVETGILSKPASLRLNSGHYITVRSGSLKYNG